MAGAPCEDDFLSTFNYNAIFQLSRPLTAWHDDDQTQQKLPKYTIARVIRDVNIIFHSKVPSWE
jgi:hypothetical protein